MQTVVGAPQHRASAVLRFTGFFKGQWPGTDFG